MYLNRFVIRKYSDVTWPIIIKRKGPLFDYILLCTMINFIIIITIYHHIIVNHNHLISSHHCYPPSSQDFAYFSALSDEEG